MAIAIHIKVAAAVADILKYEGGIPDSVTQLIMDRLADGLSKENPHTLVPILAELRLVSEIREVDSINWREEPDGNSN